ncbi:flap endonuclease-1 [Candidatus Woesearchaeota archaeon]|nr:flap endonuclease-1 [Candidatus Woesearchaeota archaeon]
MGTKLKDLLERKEITIADLQHKILVVDSFNILYQFLSTIRQRDGTLLTDSKGRVTSHITGLFARTTKLMQSGLQLAFVFDGKPPKLKSQETARRKEVKEKAKQEYEIAKQREDIAGMQKYAARTSVLTGEMVEDAKKIIQALGLPIVQAPSEGEAQAAYLVKEGKAYAEISQDMDCLLFGVPRLVRNLTITERRKMPGRFGYVEVKPEMILLEENLQRLGITQDQLIVIGMLVGTDYNIGGIKGIGPKKALELVKKYGNNFEKLFEEVHWKEAFTVEWKEIFELIQHMPVEETCKLEWRGLQKERLLQLLVEEHDFSKERVESQLEKLEQALGKRQQKGLGEFW